jgi:wyosine [tRNA(Phe)-imidazoG37] synthetase (radical SAM superfamily)
MKSYTYIFGPVPSRRLGISLGIDLVQPKTCQLNCIYCECGATTQLTTERRPYMPFQSVIDELHDYLSFHPAPEVVTFSGAGEPTLNSEIGRIIFFIKNVFPKQRIAVLTNGVNLSDVDVRSELMAADIVIPSLDAVSDAVFRRINRPHFDLNLGKIISGLVQFRRNYKGAMWLEVFIVPGLNDSPQELMLFKEVILQIAPDKIQLNTLDRPGTVEFIRAATQDELEDIIDCWDMDNVEIIARTSRRSIASYREDIESAIVQTLARRPLTLADLSEMLGLHSNEINKYLDVLEESQRIEPVIQNRGIFYRLK